MWIEKKESLIVTFHFIKRRLKNGRRKILTFQNRYICNKQNTYLEVANKIETKSRSSKLTKRVSKHFRKTQTTEMPVF